MNTRIRTTLHPIKAPLNPPKVSSFFILLASLTLKFYVGCAIHFQNACVNSVPNCWILLYSKRPKKIVAKFIIHSLCMFICSVLFFSFFVYFEFLGFEYSVWLRALVKYSSFLTKSGTLLIQIWTGLFVVPKKRIIFIGGPHSFIFCIFFYFRNLQLDYLFLFFL